MLEKVKIALRINHTLLDSDITDTIKTARSEMIRSGVSDEVANSDIELVQMAIKTYCLFVYANDTKLVDGYFNSWQYQLENIRKSNIDVPVSDDTSDSTTDDTVDDNEDSTEDSSDDTSQDTPSGDAGDSSQDGETTETE